LPSVGKWNYVCFVRANIYTLFYSPFYHHIQSTKEEEERDIRIQTGH
jgi:hypothetical protein